MTSIFHFIYKYLEIIFFTLLVVVGVAFVDDYGITWDEDTQRETGTYNYDYVAIGDAKLLSWRDQDYGPAFEMVLVSVEKMLQQTDSREIYLTRHLITHLFFLLGVFFCFKLVYKLFGNKWIALITCLCLVLHPRLYAHSFFNSKDLPFLSLLMICLYYCYWTFQDKRNQSFMILGILIGLLINIRIMGVLLPAILIVFLIIDMMLTKEYKKHLKWLGVFLGSAFIALYASWPFLWSAPFENFLTAFDNMSSFRFYAPVLFGGQATPAKELPWNYVAQWFIVTTPIIFIFIGFIGSFWFIKDCFQDFKTHFLDNKKRLFVLISCLFLGPYLAVLIFDSVLYDGWRQMYFIYVPFVLFIAYLLNELWSSKWIKNGIVGVLGISFVLSLVFMSQNRGIQHVYFNQLVSNSESNTIRKSYELDYWGTSYRQSFEYILKNNPSDSIHVLVENTPGIYNLDILSDSDRNRLQVTRVDSIIDADYFVTEYRFHPQDYESLEGKSVFQLRCLNNTISEVFQLRK